MGTRALAEGGAMLARTFAMLALVLLFADVPLAFALSQLLYSAVWVGWLARSAGGLLTFPTSLLNTINLWMLPHHAVLLKEFGGMVILKLLLTEGEKFLLLALFAEDA